MTTFEQRLKDALSNAYDIERELGGGGMSRVFVATDRSLGRKVVIKLLSPELTAEVNRGRFRREIQVAAQLQHPHIVPLLSAGEHGELVYYTMPFIVGESLKSALDKHGPLSIRDVVRVLYDIVDALAYAHEHGVVHRDIKPANILRSGNHALVTDFGVAKALNAAISSTAMTSTGMAIGTPAYMAPEQLAGDPTADHRIDIYAVGLLTYELLSGRSPFAASSPQAVLAAVLTRDPPPLVTVRPDVPRRLSEMVMQCLSKVPGGRPPSAEALMVALDMFSTSSGEIRTKEYRVPVIGPTVPVLMTPRAAPQAPTPFSEPAASFSEPAASFSEPVAAFSEPVAAFSEPAAAAFASAPSVISSAPAVVPPPIATVERSVADPVPTYESPNRKSRSKLLIGGLALLLPAVAGAILLSQRAGRKSAVEADGAVKASPPPAATVAANNTGTRAPVLTAVDSAAIAAATAKRVAAAAADERPGQPAFNADSLRRHIQKQISDSITRANKARMAAAPPAATIAAVPAETAPAPAAPPVAEPAPAPSGKKRLAIAESKAIRDNAALSSFSRSLVDALRASLRNSEGFALVDQDSVREAIANTSSRDEAARLLKPDVVVALGFTGAGDATNLGVTVWDLRVGSSYGIRMTSTRIIAANPDVSIGPVVQTVLKLLDDLSSRPIMQRRRR